MTEHPTFDEYEGTWQWTSTYDGPNAYFPQGSRLVTVDGSQSWGTDEPPTFNVVFIVPFRNNYGTMTYRYDAVAASDLIRPDEDTVWEEQERVEVDLSHLQDELDKITEKVHEAQAREMTLQKVAESFAKEGTA